MKKNVFFLSLFLSLFHYIVIAQTTSNLGPYSYTVSGSSYQMTASFTTQSWGETYMLITFKNTGTTSIDLSKGSEIWFNCANIPTVINYPILGNLSYPTSEKITAIPRGAYKIVQTQVNFPNETWANSKLGINQQFAINYSLGLNLQNSDFSTIAQSIRLYANGWTRPNLYVPLTINFSGISNTPMTINVRDRATNTVNSYRVASGTQINVFDGNAIDIWGKDSLANTTLFKSSYTMANPLTVTAGVVTSVSLPFTTSALSLGVMSIQVNGLPSGTTSKLSITSTTYPISKEISIVNGLNSIASIPYDTYNISVTRYANEATNTLAVPAYASSFSFLNSTVGPLMVAFTSSTIKPFNVDGWPKYLSMGTITLADEGNDGALSKTPLNAIFKYSGSGMGDTGVLLDGSSSNFPTTKTIQQARRLENNYASMYPNTITNVMPVMVHYTAQASGGGIGEIDVYNDVNLQIHYRNLIRETKTMLSFKDDKHPYPATYVLNPDLLGAQQQAYNPNGFNDTEIYNHTIHVNEQLISALVAEGLSTNNLPKFSNNWLGYYQSINYLIKTIGQGAIKFGWQLNVWATGTALWVFDTNNLAQSKAKQVTTFVNDKLGVFSGSWKPDFVVLDRYEADCFSPRGQNYAYNTQAWDRFVEYATEIGKNLNLPIMLWQIPGGHLVTKNETINNYNIQGHSSASATYFLGDKNVGIGTNNVRSDVLSLPLLPINTVYNTNATNIGQWLNQTPNYDYSKSQLQKLADKNIFSILWGGGETIAVAPIGTNGNDDGWLANKLLNYYSDKVYQLQTNGTVTPSVNISYPSNNSTFNVGSNITFTVSINNATVTQVSYYNGATLLGTSNTSPFSYTLNNVSAGSYSITAQAITTNGTLISTPINIVVSTSTCTAVPVVSLSTPTVLGNAPATVTLNATVAVTCGNISKVEFYNGNNLLSTISAAPYSFNWSNVAAGTYTITAKAYANNNSATSLPVTLTVSPSTSTVSCAGVAPWKSSTIYSKAGINVTYGGRLYTSMYWTQGNTPIFPYVQGNPWKDLGVCPTSTGSARINTELVSSIEPNDAMFTVYPNPSQGVVTVSFYVNEDNSGIKFEVFDEASKNVFNFQKTYSKGNQKETFNFNKYTPQVYLLRVTTENGHKLGTSKFVLEQ